MNLSLWRLAYSSRPILVGPWTSEMGFEVLYWLPFLEQLKAQYRIDSSRLVAVTRGGAGAWYGVPHTVELYDYVPPSDLRLSALEHVQQEASINQHGVTPWERQLVKLLAARLGLRRYHVLHPSVMYRTLKAYWGPQTMGFATALQHLRFLPIPVPPAPVGLTLPESFIAMRWYARPTWPMREDMVDWTKDVVRVIAQTMPVVILQTGAYLDDHLDFPPPEGEHITVIRSPQWRENLSIQSAVLKRANGFVGTWGGVAQLAVRLGLPVAAFYDQFQGASYAHKQLAAWLAMQQKTALFVGRPHDAEFIRSILPQMLTLPELPRGSSS